MIPKISFAKLVRTLKHVILVSIIITFICRNAMFHVLQILQSLTHSLGIAIYVLAIVKNAIQMDVPNVTQDISWMMVNVLRNARLLGLFPTMVSAEDVIQYVKHV